MDGLYLLCISNVDRRQLGDHGILPGPVCSGSRFALGVQLPAGALSVGACAMGLKTCTEVAAKKRIEHPPEHVSRLSREGKLCTLRA
eukprot:s2938_g8.t1